MDNEKIKNYIFHKHIIPGKEGEFCNLPQKLHPAVKEMLQKSGIDRLYSHQVEAFKALYNGEHVCLQTSTASGKTLGGLLWAINHTVANPNARTLIIEPNKALVDNIASKINEYLENLPKEVRLIAAGYDGETKSDAKTWVIERANFIVTVPEMLNISMLPHHQSYAPVSSLFDNLCFVFVDEVHYWSGIEGSNLSLLLARLDIVCGLHQAKPMFACASATIANAAEHSQNICHRVFRLIDKSGASTSEKHLYFLDTPVTRDGFPNPPSKMTAYLSSQLLMFHKKHLIFCGRRTLTDVLEGEIRKRIRLHPVASPLLARQIKAISGKNLAVQRKKMISDFTKGKLLGLISTVILELGIDLPELDYVILNSLPHTVRSFWQQVGRAGRTSARQSHCYIVLGQTPRERYVRRNIEWLLSAKAESVVINANNRNIQLQHLRAAAYEVPLSEQHVKYFPEIKSMIEELTETGELVKKSDGYHWCGRSCPANDISIRGIYEPEYVVIDTTKGEVITRATEGQAFRELYPEAIMLIDSEQYLIEALDLENHVAYCHPEKTDYYTEAIVSHGVVITDELKNRVLRSGIRIVFGGIAAVTATEAYKAIQFETRQTLHMQALVEPLCKITDTQGLWLIIPKSIVQTFHCNPEAITAIGYAITFSAAMATQADPFADMAHDSLENADGSVNVVIYDKTPGGMGFCEKAFEIMEMILHNTIQSVANCKCEDGCPECLGGNELNKERVLSALREMAGEQLALPYLEKAN